MATLTAMPHTSFDQAPFIAIWETTQACALACQHCRAEADDQHHPDELSTAEGQALIDQLQAMGTKVVVFSGGDPLQRDDLEELIRHAVSRGLRVGTIPAATERLTRDRVQSLADAGLHQMAMSLDAASATAHDGFRGVDGCFERTMTGAAWAKELQLPFQINSAFARWNRNQLEPLAALVNELGVVFWEVFFLVPTGRGADMAGLQVDDYRQLFASLYAIQQRVPFIVKITEAPHYRMFVSEAERFRAQGDLTAAETRIQNLLARELGPRRSLGQAPGGVNSGKGFLFISHTGDIQPSGFLPLTLGNVRRNDIAAIYREHPVLRELRDSQRLGGRCGRCPYRELCGGSRARAYARSGDYLAEDPDCWYQGDGT
jgi:AdoMet-dependent heme synthase